MNKEPFSQIDPNAFLNTSDQDFSLNARRLSLKKKKDEEEKAKQEQQAKEQEKPVEPTKPVEPPKVKTYDDYKIGLDDSVNPFVSIDSKKWISDANSREQQIEQALAKMNDGLMSQDAKVPSLVAREDGEKKIEMVPANAGGQLTTAGLHALDQASLMLDEAKNDRDGGFRKNQLNGQISPLWGSKMMTPYDAEEAVKQREEKTGTADYETVDEDGNKVVQKYKYSKIRPEDAVSEEHIRTVLDAVQGRGAAAPDLVKQDGFGAEQFLKYRKSIDSLSYNPSTLEAKKQIEETKDFVFDDVAKAKIDKVLGKMRAEKNMPEDKLVDVYEGQPIFNYEKIQDLNELEAQFKALPLSAAQKTRFLASFKKNFEGTAGQLLMSGAEVAKSKDYLASLAPHAAIATLLGADLPGLAAENKFIEGMQEGRSFYQMMKDNTIDLDRNLVSRAIEKTMMETMSLFQNTGIGGGAGALMIGSKLTSLFGDNAVSDTLMSGAEAMAEAGAITQEAKRNYYKKIGSDEWTALGMQISSDDLYGVAANLAELYLTAGLSKAIVSTTSKIALRNLTTKAARDLGRQSAKGLIDDIVTKGGAVSKGQAARINFKEQFKSLWTRGQAVGKAESILATSLQGSFTSAGGAISNGYSEGMQEASEKGLTGEAASEYAMNKAMGSGLVNGAATFVVMSVMNAITPGMEKILQAPETGLSLSTAIKNTLANRRNKLAISNGIKELVEEKSTRDIAKGVANAITKTSQESGVGKYIGGLAASTGSEFVEELGDAALAAAGEAYLLKDEKSRELFETGGIWPELLKAGVLGAFGGAIGNTIAFTPANKKKMILDAQKNMDAFIKENIPTVAQLNNLVEIKGKEKDAPSVVMSLQDALATGDTATQADAIVQVGQQIAAERQGLGGQFTPEIIDTSTPSVTPTPTDANKGEQKPAETPKPNTGTAPQGSGTDVKPQETGDTAPKAENKDYTISSDSGNVVNISAPVESVEKLATHAYEQAHGKTIDGGEIKISSQQDVKPMKGGRPLAPVKVTTYSVNGKPADLHSFKDKDGNEIFATKNSLSRKINQEYGGVPITKSLSDANEFAQEAKDIPAPQNQQPQSQKPASKPAAQEQKPTPKPSGENQSPDGQSDSALKPEQKKKLTLDEVKGRSVIVNEDKLDDNAKGVINKAKRILARLKTSVVVYENEQDLVNFGISSEVRKKLLESGSSAAFVNYEGVGRFILVKKNASDFERTMQHETFHAIERDFADSLEGAELATKAADEVANSKKIEAEMIEEYGSSYKNKSPINKLGEVLRAFVAGKKIGHTLGMPNFQKYLSKFLKRSKQIVKNNPSYAKYQKQFEAYFDEMVKEDDGLFVLKSESNSFKEWFANLSEKAKGFIPKKKTKTEKPLVAKTVNNEIVDEIANRVSTAIVAEKMDGASVTPEQILQGIVDLVNDELVGVGEALSVASKLAVFDKAVEGWVNNEQIQDVADVIARYRQKLNNEKTPSIMFDIAEEPAVGESVKEKARVRDWTSVKRFIRDKDVSSNTNVVQDNATPSRVEGLPFTNASIDLFANTNGDFRELNLNFGDVVEILDANGVVNGVMVYSHSVKSKDENGVETLSHKFMRGQTVSNGKATPFSSIRQAQFAREFYEAIASSDKHVMLDANGNVTIENVEKFIETIFNTMVDGSSNINFKEVFNFTNDPNAKTPSAFSFQHGKINVNTAKLKQDFAFIKSDMFSTPEKAETTKMLIASAVRSALEEEFLHYATLGTFKAHELRAFADDLLSNQAFDGVVAQIKEMQSIKNENDKLTDSEKAVIAGEFLSMVHQKAAEGATYSDHYNDLVARALGNNTESRNTAVQYADRLKYIMGARMATSYMSPRMQEMVARLALAKRELGLTKRSSNMADFVTSFTQQQYDESRNRLQSIIDEAFVVRYQAINDLRDELADLGVPVRNILFFDFESGEVGLNQNASDYYENRYGKEALAEIEDYFSRLKENGALNEFASTVRAARARMDNLKESLDYSNPFDSAVISAVNGDFSSLIQQIKLAQESQTPIAVGEILGILNSFDFSKNQESQNDNLPQYVRDGTDLRALAFAKILISKKQELQKALRNEAVALLRDKSTVSLDAENTPYARYAQSVNDYNELVTEYADIVLNKNLNKVDEFGRAFLPLSAIKEISSTVPYNENMFGYSNQNSIAARLARKAARDKADELKGDKEATEKTFEWQHAFSGRYVSLDRSNNPLKVTTIDSNAAYLGEQAYNDFLIGKLSGAQFFSITGQQSAQDYYQTMGFNTSDVDVDIDQVATKAALSDQLLKYTVPDIEVTTFMGENGLVKLPIRKLSPSVIARMVQSDKYSKQAVKTILNAFFEENNIDGWFAGLQFITGYNRQNGLSDVVQEVNGKQSFASKFAEQMKFRMFNNKLTAGSGAKENVVNPDSANPSLFEYLKKMREVHYHLNPAQYKGVDGYKSQMSEADIIGVLAELPDILEAIDALNHDIGLARKAYSRFKSQYLKRTILGDIRLIQQQGADGIRANLELRNAIKNSFGDIEAIEDIEWMSGYNDKNGPIGFKGITATQLMNRLASIPSSAAKEYFITNTPTPYVQDSIERFYNLLEVFGNPMQKIDGKSTQETFNLVFNTLERPEDRPNENDPDFNADLPNRAGFGDETAGMMPQGSEQTPEQLEAVRKADLNEELKKIRSWVTHAGAVVFQSIPEEAGDYYSSKIDISRLKMVMNAFAAVMEQDGSYDQVEYNKAKDRLEEFLFEQTSFLAAKYSNADKSVSQDFLDIISNIRNYQHPMQYLMDVVSAIAVKERQFVNEQTASSTLIGDYLLRELKKASELQNVELLSVKSKREINQEKILNELNQSLSILEKGLFSLKRKTESIEENDEEEPISVKRFFLNSGYFLRVPFLESQNIPIYEFETNRDVQYQIDAIRATIDKIEKTRKGKSVYEANQNSAQQILDSLQEDIDKRQLTPGTLFHARSHTLSGEEGLLDSAIFAKSPLFSLLIQAMPNLVIYQPNESYTGKNQRVQNDIEFAELPNGDAVLFVRDPYGLGSAKQSQILEQVLIGQINKERSITGEKAPTILAIKRITSQIREHAQRAFVATPERIDAMTQKVFDALSQSNLAPVADILVSKYRQQLETEASEKLTAILQLNAGRTLYVEKTFGERGQDMVTFMKNLIRSDSVTGETSIAEDVKLLVDMFTNPDAYKMLGNLGMNDGSLVSFALPPNRAAFLDKAIQMLPSREIQSSLIHQYAIERGEGQDIDEFNTNNLGLNEKADLDVGVWGVTAADFYSDFESRFFDDDFESIDTARANKKMIDGANAINPSLAKMLIDQIMLNIEMSSDEGMSKLTFDQINQASGAMEAFMATPDHFYRFAASELINALESRLPTDGLTDSSIFTEAGARNPIAADDVFTLISNSGQFPLLMRSIGRQGYIANADITSYYYNKTPVTQMFDRNRRDMFISAMLSSTDYGKKLLDNIQNSQANLNSAFTYKSIDLVEEISDVGILGNIRMGLSDIIGSEIANQAEANVNKNIAYRDQRLKDIRARIAEIDDRIAKLKAEGEEAIRNKILADRGKFSAVSTIALSQLSDRIAKAVLSQNLGNQSDAAAVIERIEKGSVIKALQDLRTYLGKVSGLDSKIAELLDDSDALRNNSIAFNNQLGVLLKNRRHFRIKVNSTLQIVSDAYVQAMKSDLENSAFALSNNSYESEPSAISEFQEFSLIDRDPVSSIVNSELRQLVVPIIQATEITPDNIDQFKNEINRTLVGRGLITGQMAKKYLEAYNSFVDPANVSRMIERYISSKDVKDAVKAEVEAIINNPKTTESEKELFRRLKKKQQSKALSDIVDATKGIYDEQQIREIISEKLSKNNSVLNQLADELLFSDLDFVTSSFDESNEETGDGISDNAEIATGLVNREIERLADQRRALSFSEATLMQDPESFGKNKLFKIKRRVAFNEFQKEMRLMSGLPAYHEIIVNVAMDRAALMQSQEGQARVERYDKSMAIINEAMRLFIEKEGQAMYRRMNEDSEVFADNFDLRQKMDRIMDIAKFRNQAQSDADVIFDANVEALRTQSEDKSLQLFGIGTREMVAMGLEPAVVAIGPDGVTVETANAPKYENDLDRMKRVALFINDQHSTSVFMPTTEKLQEDITKSYLVYNRSAKLELNKIRRREDGKWSVDEELKDILFNAAVSPKSQDAQRHAELEQKYNDGTITDAELQEANGIVERRTREAGYTEKGIRAGVYKDGGIPMLPSTTGGLGSAYYAILGGKVEDVSEFAGDVTGDIRKDPSYQMKAGEIFIDLGENPLRLKHPTDVGDWARSRGLMDRFEKWLDYQFTVNEAYRAIGSDKRGRNFNAATARIDMADSLEARRAGRLVKKTAESKKEQADALLAQGYSRQELEDLGYFRDTIETSDVGKLNSFLFDQGIVSSIIVDWGALKGTNREAGDGRAFVEVAVANPNQIKSAEPFTGVPLDQRFDVSNPSILFDVADDGTPSRKLRTQSQQSIDADLDAEVSSEIKSAIGATEPITLRSFISRLKQINTEYFIKETIGATISPLAKGLGMFGVIKPINRMKDADIESVFDTFYNYATDAVNEPVLQASGFELLKKEKSAYTAEQKKELVGKLLSKVTQENKFLNPESKASHALLHNEALIEDLAMMLNSESLKKKNANNRYSAIVGAAIESISKFYNIEKSVANSTTMGPYNLSRAVKDVDLTHNWASLYSVIYGGNLLRKIAVGAYNPTVKDKGFAQFTLHQNALVRNKFSMNYGSYLEALNMIGLLDQGINGFSGKNRYGFEYQDVQDKLGKAAEGLNNNYLNGAKAYLIASIKGTRVANDKDGGEDKDLGLKVWQFFYSLENGLNEHEKALKNKGTLKKALGKLRYAKNKAVGVLFHNGYNSLSKQEREDEGIQAIKEMIKPFMSSVTRDANFPRKSREDIDLIINSFVAKLESGLSEKELTAVRKYSDTLIDEFSDIVDGHRIANTFASQDNRLKMTQEKLQSEESLELKDLFSRNYSVVPLRFGYVKNPLNTSMQTTGQDNIGMNEYVSFEQSSINYKGRRLLNAQEAKEKGVLRPIDLNAFTAPDAIASDALYRTYIAPTYMIVRKLMGRIAYDNNTGHQYTENGFLDDVAQIEAGNEGVSDNKYAYVSAYIMSTIEKQIKNEMAQNGAENVLDEYLRFGNMIMLGKTLIDVWQPIANGLIPAIGKASNIMISRLLRLNDKSIARFLEALKISVFDSMFKKGGTGDAAKFVKENSYSSYKHKADGADIRATQIRRTKYHNENKSKYGVRYLQSHFVGIIEKSLDVLIGAPERVLVDAIYTFELHNLLQEELGKNAPATIRDMFKLNPDEISTLAKTRADIMVTDFMGLGDKTKKAGAYNFENKNALVSALFAGLLRHGNHNATVNANRAVFANMLLTRNSKGDKVELDPRMRKEALENMLGTTIQNSLFLVARLALLAEIGTLLASAIYEWFDIDEPEEDQLEQIIDRASEWKKAMTEFDEEGNWILNVIKEQMFSGAKGVIGNDDIPSEDKLSVLGGRIAKDLFADAAGSIPGLGPVLSFPAISNIAGMTIDSAVRKFAGESQGSSSQKGNKYTEMMKRVGSIESSFVGAASSPYAMLFDFAALLQNRFNPREGFDGIDNKEFAYGLINLFSGSRNGYNRVPKRHAEAGGWGYSVMQDEGVKQYILGEEED